MKARTTFSCLPVVLAVWVLNAALGTAATFISTLNQPVSSSYQMYSAFLNSNFANDFTTDGTGAVITGLTVKLANYDTVTRHVYGSIYTNNAGQPGTLVGSFDPIALTNGLTTLTDVTLTSTGVNLAANTTYWVGIGLVENLTSDTVRWAANAGNGTDAGSVFTTVPATNVFLSSNGGTVWSSYSAGNMLYALSGTAAPEPSRMVLVLAGGFGVWLRRRRSPKVVG